MHAMASQSWARFRCNPLCAFHRTSVPGACLCEQLGTRHGYRAFFMHAMAYENEHD